MRVFLSYGYRPYTTAVYYERALAAAHNLVYFGPPFGDRPGYLPNQDVTAAIRDGLQKPDFFFFIEPGCGFFPHGMERLDCPTACYLIDVHSDLWVRDLYAPFFDYVFVAQKDYVEHFKRMLGHDQVYWLPLACDPTIHGERPSPRIYDVGFVGKPFAPSHARTLLLEQLSRRYRMNDYKQFYPKEEITTVYSQSKIVVNVPYRGDVNMRVFEVLASGALLMTEGIQNGQGDLFQDRVHLVEYTSESDLLEKADYYLGHEEQRVRIAKAGQELALAKHTYSHRCDFILDTIFGNREPGRRATARAMSNRQVHHAYARVYSMLRLADPVLDEMAMAKGEEGASRGLSLELGKSLLRRVNLISPLTPGARRARRTAAAQAQK